MAASYRFQPRENDFPDRNENLNQYQELNQPLNEVRAAFEVLLPVVGVAPEAIEDRGAINRGIQLLNDPAVPNDNDPGEGAPVVVVGRGRGRGTGGPRQRQAAPAAHADQLDIIVNPDEVVVRGRGRGRGRPRLHRAAPAARAEHLDIPDPDEIAIRGRGRARGRGRIRGRGRARGAAVLRNLAQADSEEDSDDNPDPLIERFFDAVDRRNRNQVDARMARFNEQQRLAREESEEEVNDALEIVAAMEERIEDARDAEEIQEPEAPPAPILAVNPEGQCSVCWTRPPDTVLNRCGHIFCIVCIQELERLRRRRCPVCRLRFHIHRPLSEIELRNQSIEQQEPAREESEVDISEASETVAAVGEQMEGGRDIEETQEPEDPPAPIREVDREGPCQIF